MRLNEADHARILLAACGFRGAKANELINEALGFFPEMPSAQDILEQVMINIGTRHDISRLRKKRAVFRPVHPVPGLDAWGDPVWIFG